MKVYQSRRRVRSRRLIVIGVVLVLVLGAIFFYWRSTFSEDTDDAQVDGNLYQVSSRVTGHVVKVYVDDNQTVQAGQLLVEIDPTDYQVALDQAEADLANAQAQYAQATVNVPITSHDRGHNRDHDGLRCEGVERHGGAGPESRWKRPRRGWRRRRPTSRRRRTMWIATRRWCRRT